MIKPNNGLEHIKETAMWLPDGYLLSTFEHGMKISRIWFDPFKCRREKKLFITFEELECSISNPFEAAFEKLQEDVPQCLRCDDTGKIEVLVDVFDLTIPQKHPCPDCKVD